MKKSKKIVKILMVSKETLPTSSKPMMAQTINLAEDVEDDEEDLFLAANPTLIPVFEVDVPAIVNRYAEAKSKLVPQQHAQGEEETSDKKNPKEKKKDQKGKKKQVDALESLVEDQDLPPKEAIIHAEMLYDKMVDK